MPRNDPTDTGGLFIGRRPGTGPLRYRGAPERGGAGRQRADAALAAATLVLIVLLCLTLWGPQPVAWLWVGSQVDYRTGSVTAGIAVAFAGMIGTLMLTLALATRLDRAWRILRRASGHEQREGVLVRIFAWFVVLEGTGSQPGAAVIRRLREYYRQFEELSPEEISLELRERRDEERSRAPAEVPALDLSTPAWHEPPDAEAVNAATYALRRAVNAYPDDAPLREALAERHAVVPDQVAPGHGAGELLHAAFRALGGGQVAIAWPGWGPLPRLVHEAGGVPVPVPLTAAGAADPDALAAAVGPDTTAVALCTPNDPTGAAVPPPDLERLAGELDERVWLVVDAALGDFERGHAPLVARARVLVVRSFSKAHAMAGFRAGYALANDAELVDRLTPAGGVSAPAQAAMLWAVRHGDALVARRRAAAARERERLAQALRGTPFSFPAGHGHLVWLSSTEHDGAEIAHGLAAQRVYVAPGSAWGDDLHVRVALRDGAATDRLSAALREL